jgi:hypothetical protein
MTTSRSAAMNATRTADPATAKPIRRRVARVLAGVTALATAVTWTETAAVATATESVSQIVAADAEPIVVADAYHGVGFEICPDGSAPLKVADAYHGVGVTVCL